MSVSEKKANSILFAVIITKSLRLTSTEIDKIGQGKILSILEKRHVISGFIRLLAMLLLIPLFVAASGFGLLSFLVSWRLTKFGIKNNAEKDKHSKNLIKEVTEVIKGIKAIKDKHTGSYHF